MVASQNNLAQKSEEVPMKFFFVFGGVESIKEDNILNQIESGTRVGVDSIF